MSNSKQFIMIILVLVLCLGMVQGANANTKAEEKGYFTGPYQYREGYKQVIFADVGWRYLLNFGVTVVIDLDDLKKETPDGKAGWVTVWMTSGLGIGVSLSPAEIGYGVSQFTEGYDINGNPITDVYDPGTGGISTSFTIGPASFSGSESGVSATVQSNVGVGFLMSTTLVAVEMRRSEVLGAILNAQDVGEISELLAEEIHLKWGKIINSRNLSGAVGQVIFNFREPAVNGEGNEKYMKFNKYELQMKALDETLEALEAGGEEVVFPGHAFARRRVITPEMLHHDGDMKGKKKYHFFAGEYEKCKFTLEGFTSGSVIKVDACIPGSTIEVRLVANEFGGYYAAHSQEQRIATVKFTITDNLRDDIAKVTVSPRECSGIQHGYIMFEDSTWNAANKGTEDEYTYYKGEYVKKSEIEYPIVPKGIIKAPEIQMKPMKQCEDCGNMEEAPKGNLIPRGGVVMCQDADWFCYADEYSAECLLYAINKKNYFKKGWTYDYSNSGFTGAGDGSAMAVFIYNYGCKSNMNGTFEFYQPNGQLWVSHTKNYYCGNPGYWGYMILGLFINDEDWFPEGRWTLKIKVGGSLKKTVYFDVYPHDTSDLFTFINPTPDNGATISGNLTNGQYHMTAAANGHVGGADQMKFYINGSCHHTIGVHEPIGTSVWNVRDAADDTYKIRAEINGTLGWLSTEERTITIDNTPPPCNITSPSAGTTIRSPYTTVNVSASGADYVEFYVDGKLRGYDEIAPFSQEILLINDDGNVDLTAIAYDNVGNSKASSVKTVNLRCVYIASPLDGADLPNNGNIEIEAKTVGFNGTVRFYIDGVYKRQDTSPPYTYNWNSTGYSGLTTFKVVGVYGSPYPEYEIDVLLGGGLTEWNYTESMQKERCNQGAAIIMNGYIYAMGGADEEHTAYPHSSIEQAKINPDGTLEAWKICGSLTEPIQYIAAVHTENYIYAIGGIDRNFSTSRPRSVDRIPIYADGSVGQAVTLSSTLNKPRSSHSAVISGDYVYVIGGSSSSTARSVEYAHIEENGDLGAWTLSDNELNDDRYKAAVVTANGYIYAICGYDGDIWEYGSDYNDAVPTVERAKINSDGSLSAWTIISMISNPKWSLNAVVNNNFIYLIGGSRHPWRGYRQYLREVERAYIYDDGSLSSWTSTASLDKGRFHHCAVTNTGLNNTIYVVGGNADVYSGCGADDSVEYIVCGNSPTITGVPSSSDITSSSAKITWTTDILCDSRVDFWTDDGWPNYFSTPVYNTSDMVTNHNVTIEQYLEAGTQYYYRVVSKNSKGNVTMDGCYNFTTSEETSPPPSDVVEYPWADNENGSIRINRNYNYTMGYHFTPQVDGYVTALGGYFNGTKTVKLWNKSTGAELASTTVTSSYNWSYTEITPVAVEAGVTYTVAAYIAGSGGTYRFSGLYNNFPKTCNNIKIEASTYIYKNGRPTNSRKDNMFGQADICFTATGSSIISDNFDDNTIDTSIWSTILKQSGGYSGSANCHLEETGGEIKMYHNGYGGECLYTNQTFSKSDEITITYSVRHPSARTSNWSDAPVMLLFHPDQPFDNYYYCRPSSNYVSMYVGPSFQTHDIRVRLTLHGDGTYSRELLSGTWSGCNVSNASIGTSWDNVQEPFAIGFTSYVYSNYPYYWDDIEITSTGGASSAPVVELPESYTLSQNYPNPFNPKTTIKYELPNSGDISLKIYNVTGQLVRTLVNNYEEAGYHSIEWNGDDENGRSVASGIYIYRLINNEGIVDTKKMIMVK